MPPFHINTREWAQTVIADMATFAFSGIKRVRGDWANRPQGRKSHDLPKNSLAASLLDDERYMEEQFDAEVQCYLDKDYDDEWREYCDDMAHTRCTCPHEDPDAYKAAAAKRFADGSARYEWATDRVDWYQVREYVIDWTTDVDSVAHFLLEHPVAAVMRTQDEWLDIDEVEVYCTDCDEAHTEEEAWVVGKTIPGSAWVHDPTPAQCRNCSMELHVQARSSVPGAPRRYAFCGTQYDTAIEEP